MENNIKIKNMYNKTEKIIMKIETNGKLSLCSIPLGIHIHPNYFNSVSTQFNPCLWTCQWELLTHSSLGTDYQEANQAH